jgi:hypothetical protein
LLPILFCDILGRIRDTPPWRFYVWRAAMSALHSSSFVPGTKLR